MKKFDVHFITTASDYISIDAETAEEARLKMKAYVEENFEAVIEGLVIGLDFVEPQDIEITDVVEYE